MTLYVAGYKAPGKLTDKVVRAALSVRHFTPVIYSHVELLVDRPYPLGNFYNDYLQHSLAASKRDDNEVREKPIYFTAGHWDFVELRHDPDINVWEEAETLIGTPYDLWGAILCVTPWARLHPDKEWCSGMIADICMWEDPETYDPHMIMMKCLSLGGEFIEG